MQAILCAYHTKLNDEVMLSVNPTNNAEGYNNTLGVFHTNADECYTLCVSHQ